MPDLSVESSAATILPEDAAEALLIGRVASRDGRRDPSPFVLSGRELVDLSRLAPTVSDLLDLPDAAAAIRRHAGAPLGSLDATLAANALLAPCDLQAIKASGVTFVESLLERVIEERARGDAASARELRATLAAALGGSLAGLKPGSPAAEAARTALMQQGLWSQYLEVGIGHDAEIFTKAQPLAAVGHGAALGLDPRSTWSTSEPEIVLAVNSRAEIVGAALGNDLTLRDFEGRSALLLGRAKDGNATCAIGPFIRLFDATFSLDHVRRADVHIEVAGRDGFHDRGTNTMRAISRDPADLVRATIGREHQYPDGLMLFLGTMYVPARDRYGTGSGFTHAPGDVVRIHSRQLGALANPLASAEHGPRWDFGLRALARSLARRGLLQRD
jgi:fumarylacetoacetate (FAA) hydrolase family protein